MRRSAPLRQGKTRGTEGAMAAGSVVKTLPADVLLVAELAALDLNRVFHGRHCWSWRVLLHQRQGKTASREPKGNNQVVPLGYYQIVKPGLLPDCDKWQFLRFWHNVGNF